MQLERFRFPMRQTTWRAGALLALLLGVGACSCGETATEQRRAILWIDLEEDPTREADRLLDFGQVMIGDTKLVRLELENRGSVDLVVEPSPLEAPFSIDGIVGPMRISPGTSRTLSLSFLPFQIDEEPAEQILEFRTNEGGSSRSRRIRLMGQGISSSLVCNPSSLDFGRSGLGATRVVRTSCVNTQNATLRLEELPIEGVQRGSFAVQAPSMEGDHLLLEPEESVEVEVEFRALGLGPHDARLVLGGAGQTRLGAIPLRAEVVASELELNPPGCLDFGFAAVGGRVERTLEVRNRGEGSAELVELSLPAAAAGSFSVQTPLPLEVGSAPAEVVVEFHPEREGLHTFSIEVLLLNAEGDEEVLSTCARGFGGGPRLICENRPVDFGAVAVASPRTQRMSCINEGSVVEGAEVALIESLSVDNPVFSLEVRNFDQSVGEKVGGYGPGDGFWIEATFDPVEEGFTSGALRLESASIVGGLLEVPLAGEGRALEPCELAIDPPLLYVGRIPAGETIESRLELRNEKETTCLIRDLRLAEGSDPAFSIQELGTAEVGGGETLVVEIRFSPEGAAGQREGAIEFEISNSTDRYQRVEVRGMNSEACLVFEPREIDFGPVEPGCKSAIRAVHVMNQCGWPLEYVSVGLAEGSVAGDFELISRPAAGAVLGSFEWAELKVRFQPSELGARQADVELSTALAGYPHAEDVQSISLRGEGAEGREVTDVFSQRGHPEIDVLFVIDNNFQMADNFRVMSYLPQFLEWLLEEEVDFQLGVTTSGVGGPRTWNCFGMEGGQENGRLYPIDGSHPRILSRETPELRSHWRHNINVGGCGSGFYFLPLLEAAHQALTPPLISSAVDPRAASGFQDGNLGFLRPSAALSIVFITATKDASEGTVASYLDSFFKVKGPFSSGFLKIHVIADPFQKGEYCGMVPCNRLAHGAELTKGLFIDYDSDWRDGLRGIVRNGLGFQASFGLRNTPVDANGDGQVDEADLVVRVDGIEREPVDPSGARIWWLREGAIVFEPQFKPMVGSTIEVRYTVGCGG